MIYFVTCDELPNDNAVNRGSVSIEEYSRTYRRRTMRAELQKDDDSGDGMLGVCRAWDDQLEKSADITG